MLLLTSSIGSHRVCHVLSEIVDIVVGIQVLTSTAPSLLIDLPTCHSHNLPLSQP